MSTMGAGCGLGIAGLKAAGAVTGAGVEVEADDTGAAAEASLVAGAMEASAGAAGAVVLGTGCMAMLCGEGLKLLKLPPEPEGESSVAVVCAEWRPMV